jgi:hypothetical protein
MSLTCFASEDNWKRRMPIRSTAQCSQLLGRLDQIEVVGLSTKQGKAMTKLVGDSDLDPSGDLDSCDPAPRNKSLGGVLSGHMKWTLGKTGVHIKLVRQRKGQGRAVIVDLFQNHHEANTRVHRSMVQRG